ncbi:unnamed protein product, partial [Lampetra planeri]
RVLIVKGDRCPQSSRSQNNSNFRGVWNRSALPTEKNSSSVAVGNPTRTGERETTHAASGSRPTICSPPQVKEHMNVRLGHFCKDQWSSTSKETFCYHKPGEKSSSTDKRNRNFSSVPTGDMNNGRNKERMSVTTNRIFFSNLNPMEVPVFVSGAKLMTKSHVQFSPAHQSDLCYTTTASEHFSKKEGARPRPVLQLPSKILSGPDMTLSSIKSFTLELDGGGDTAFSGGELVTGKWCWSYAGTPGSTP